MKALTDLAESWEAKAKHWKRAASQQRGTKCHDEKTRLVMKSELAAGHARELRAAMALVGAEVDALVSEVEALRSTAKTGSQRLAILSGAVEASEGMKTVVAAAERARARTVEVRVPQGGRTVDVTLEQKRTRQATPYHSGVEPAHGVLDEIGLPEPPPLTAREA